MGLVLVANHQDFHRWELEIPYNLPISKDLEVRRTTAAFTVGKLIHVSKTETVTRLLYLIVCSRSQADRTMGNGLVFGQKRSY